MSEYHFGGAPGHLPKRADKIARKRGAYLVNYTEPRGEKRHWFACPNRGEPLDGQTARSVLEDLRKAEIIPPAGE